MPAVTVFEQISVPLPKERIYRRLGYKKGFTGLAAELRHQLQSDMEDALGHIRLKGAARRIQVCEKSAGSITLAGGIELSGRGVALLLKNSNEALLMGATGGPEIMAAIGRLSKGGELTKAVVFDAVASEVVDSALDWITRYFNNALRREGKIITARRYSAGYADFVLQNQAIFFRELQMEKLGVQLTDSFMLVPEKSVTAIAGILMLAMKSEGALE